jgi:ATP adenylyltransferase
LQRLWSPWRYDYITSGGGSRENVGCVFCAIAQDPGNDELNFVLHRAEYNFVVLNIYPYISGHILVVPYEHLAELDEVPEQTSNELMELTKKSQTALREAYNPGGFNIGINLGAAAGAGIKNHLHIHVLPRWAGDTNFMTSVGDTRVIPEALKTTYEKLRGRFQGS